jgi:RNA polymerase sigma factor (sigma-70 family)
VGLPRYRGQAAAVGEAKAGRRKHGRWQCETTASSFSWKGRGALKSSAELRTDAVPDRPAAADAAELRLTLLDALGQLSPRDRAIIVLRYWEDHSIQTVSELLDLSPGVVKVHSMRALARLRTLLGEDEAPPPLPPEPGARDAILRPPVARSRP